MSEELTEAREWLRRYLHDEGVVFNHNVTAMENEILAGLAPILRRQVAAEIIDALNAGERDYVKPGHFDAYLAGLSAAKEIARRVGDPS